MIKNGSVNDMEKLIKLAQILGDRLRQRHYTLALAESCTGGGLAQIVTSVPESSEWFDRGFVTYSNAAKQEMLGISAHIIAEYGAVSKETAFAMAEGALEYSHADFAAAITGLAGPSSDASGKPVGLVWFGFAHKNQPTETISHQYKGDRLAICNQAIEFALTHLIAMLK